MTGLVDCFSDFLTDSFDLTFYLEKICSLVGLKRGGTVCVCVKSGLKQEKSSVRPFNYTQVFYTGLLLKRHGTSCIFLRLLLRGLYGPSYVSSFKSGVKNSTIQ